MTPVPHRVPDARTGNRRTFGRPRQGDAEAPRGTRKPSYDNRPNPAGGQCESTPHRDRRSGPRRVPGGPYPRAGGSRAGRRHPAQPGRPLPVPAPAAPGGGRRAGTAPGLRAAVARPARRPAGARRGGPRGPGHAHRARHRPRGRGVRRRLRPARAGHGRRQRAGARPGTRRARPRLPGSARGAPSARSPRTPHGVGRVRRRRGRPGGALHVRRRRRGAHRRPGRRAGQAVHRRAGAGPSRPHGRPAALAAARRRRPRPSRTGRTLFPRRRTGAARPRRRGAHRDLRGGGHVRGRAAERRRVRGEPHAGVVRRRGARSLDAVARTAPGAGPAARGADAPGTGPSRGVRLRRRGRRARPRPAGEYTPATAWHAWRQGKAAGLNVAASLGGRGGSRPYRHREPGCAVDLGGTRTAAGPLGVRLPGPLAGAAARARRLAATPGDRIRDASGRTRDAMPPRGPVPQGLARPDPAPRDTVPPGPSPLPDARGRPPTAFGPGATTPTRPTNRTSTTTEIR